MAANWSRFKTAMEGIAIVATIVTTSTTLVLKNKADVQAEKIQEIQQQQQASKLALEQLQAINNYNLEVYKKVVEALEKKDERMERVATALVEAMPSESPLRMGLLQAIAIGATSREAKEVASFVAAQAVPNRAPTDSAESWDNWDVDVFYCANEKDGEARAEMMAQELRARPLAGTSSVGRIRTRGLPESVNQRAGYQISGIQVRFEHNENAAAQGLMQVVRPLVDKAYGSGTAINATRVASSTPGYLSLFLCAEPTKQPAHVAGDSPGNP